MTENDLLTYKTLVTNSYVQYVLDIINRGKVSRLDLKYEMDTKLWILSKAVGIILEYDINGGNYYEADNMLKWQDIMNDIMRTKWYIDFEIS